MTNLGEWQYRISRRLGRIVTRTAALVTLERMPPFVSASALIIEGDRVLVVGDPIRNEFVLPGGHLRWRETPRQAVVREVREETGYRVDTSDVVAILAGEEWTGEPGIVRVIFAATTIGGELDASAEGIPAWTSLAEFAVSQSRDAPIARLWLSNSQHCTAV